MGNLIIVNVICLLLKTKKGNFKFRNSKIVRFNENEIYFKHKKTQKLGEDIDHDSKEISFLSPLTIDLLLPKNVDEGLQTQNWFKAIKMSTTLWLKTMFGPE